MIAVVTVVVILSSVGNINFENIFNNLVLVGRRELNSKVRKLFRIEIKDS